MAWAYILFRLSLLSSLKKAFGVDFGGGDVEGAEMGPECFGEVHGATEEVVGVSDGGELGESCFSNASIVYNVAFNDVFSCEEVMYGKCRMSGSECSEGVLENNICFGTVAIEKSDFCIGVGVKEGTNHTHTGGDTNTARDENEVWCEGLIRIEKTVGGGGGERVAYLVCTEGTREITHLFYRECEEWVMRCTTDAITFPLCRLEIRKSYGEVLAGNEVWLLTFSTEEKSRDHWRLFFLFDNSPGDARWHDWFHNQESLRGGLDARVRSSGTFGREVHPSVRVLLRE